MKALDLVATQAPGSANGSKRGVLPLAAAKPLSKAQGQSLARLQEAWQSLALRLLRDDSLVRPWALGITSALPQEGRTTSAIGLAIALAKETKDRVALLEADWMNPAIVAGGKTQTAPGLIDYLEERCELEKAFIPTNRENLTLIAAGAMPAKRPEFSTQDNPAIALRQKMPSIIATLKRHFGYVVVDMPPLLSDVHAGSIASLLDASVLVVRAGMTPLGKAREAVRLMDRGNLIGIVHMGVPTAIPRFVSDLLLE